MQVKRVRCESSGVLVPKDKAIKRFIVRNIVDASAIRDIQDASVLEGESRIKSLRRHVISVVSSFTECLLLPTASVGFASAFISRATTRTVLHFMPY